MTTTAPAPAERLIRALEAHLAAGEADIAECQDLEQSTNDPVARLLLGLIVEDERRQHGLLARIVRRLQNESDATAVPVPAQSDLIGDEEAVSRLRTLIRDQEEAARYMRHLARHDPNLYAGLFALLFETVARDSQKHAYVLRYLLRSVEAR